MPVDPNISLGVKSVDLPNPLQMALQGAILRNQTLSGNQLQQSMGSNQAVSQAIQRNTGPDGTVNLAGVQSDIAKDPNAAYNLQEATGTNLGQQGTQIANQSNQLELAKQQISYQLNQAGALLNKPDLSRDDIVQSIASGMQAKMIDQPHAVAALNNLPQGDDPVALRAWLTNQLATSQQGLAHLNAITPNVAIANNGQQQVPVNTNPNAGPVGPMAGATPIQNQLPPTTPTIGGPSGMQAGYVGPQAAGATTPASAAVVQTESNGNPNAVSQKGAQGAWQVMPNTQENPGFGVTPAQNNSPQELDRVGRDYYNAMTQKYGNPTLGAIAYNMGPGATDKWLQKGGKFEDLPQETRNYVGKVSTLTALNGMGQQPGATAAAKPGFVPSAPPPGAAQNVEGTAATVNKHWDALSSDATGAQTGIGIAQNIKALADKAITGTEQGKLAFMNGVLAQFGVPAADDVKTATDLMEKNMQRLALTSRSSAGGTDAAGALAAAANPHGTMSKDAIKDAADQVIGQYQMALSQQKVLQPFKLNNDVNGYQQTLTKFNQAADPRVWQFKNMSPEQRQQFKASMSPADQKSFSTKIRTLDSLGALQ